MSGSRAFGRLLPAILLSGLVFGACSAAAQHRLRGDLGADLSIVDLQNQIEDSPEPYEVRRGISDQFLKLLLTGPLWDSGLGNYSVRTRLAGQYYSVNASAGSGSEYTNPQPTALGLSLGLFPARRYPLRLFYSYSEIAALNYEQENRAVSDQANPELAAVRRYDATNEALGGDWRYGISPTSDIVVEARHQNSSSLRQYDFNEQRDIWVEFVTPSPDPTLPVVTIVVQNGIPEGEVDLLVDGILIATLIPEERFEFSLDAGTHDVQFFPTQFNNFFQIVDVGGDMIWTASFNNPPGRNDVDRTEDAGRMEWVAGRDRRLANASRMLYSDAYDAEIGRDALSVDLENDLSFDWTQQSNLRSTTSWSLTQSAVAGSSSQDTRNLRQQTSMGYRSFEGGVAAIEHLYDRTNAITGTTSGEEQLITTQNRLRAEIGRPMGPLRHRLTLRDMMTHLSNTEDYRTFENRFEVQNELSWFAGNFQLRPRSVVALANASRKNPDSAFREFEVRELLEADRRSLWVFGDVMGSVEFGWRRRAEDLKTDKTVRYNGAIRLTRNFARGYQLFLSANSNNESYNTQFTDPDAQQPEQREPQKQRSFRGSVRANPIPQLMVNAGYSHTSQVNQVQTEIRLDVTVRLPKLGIPITTAFTDQSRQITGRRDQTTLRWETRTSFSIRDIRVQIEHAYVAETLFTEDYGLHMFRAEITRAFSIF